MQLRNDELSTDNDFQCKFCQTRQLLSSINTSGTARSSFYTNQPTATIADTSSSTSKAPPLTTNLFEAKKNFLYNVDEIDFRERAEFENNEISKSLPPTQPIVEPDQSTTDSGEPNSQSQESELEKIWPATTDDDEWPIPGQFNRVDKDNLSGSDLSLSDGKPSDNNYTDDEQSSTDGKEDQSVSVLSWLLHLFSFFAS